MSSITKIIEYYKILEQKDEIFGFDLDLFMFIQDNPLILEGKFESDWHYEYLWELYCAAITRH